MELCLDPVVATVRPVKHASSLPSLLPRHFQPQEIANVHHGLEKWGAKIQRGIEYSDPARAEEFQSFIENSKGVITNSMFNETELKMWRERQINELHDKRINRKRFRFQEGLDFTKKKL